MTSAPPADDQALNFSGPVSAPVTPADWLKQMFGSDAPGYATLWEKSSKATVAFPANRLDAAGNAASEIGSVGEVYYGVGLQEHQPEGRSRGKSDGVCAIGSIWCDIDIAGAGHAQSALPRSMKEAKDFLNSLPIPPTAIIFTGGGVHAYWLFDKLWRFHTPAERKCDSAWKIDPLRRGIGVQN